MFGAGANLAIYSLCLLLWPQLVRWLVVPLAAGSAVGLVFNFIGSRLWVFSHPKSHPRRWAATSSHDRWSPVDDLLLDDAMIHAAAGQLGPNSWPNFIRLNVYPVRLTYLQSHFEIPNFALKFKIEHTEPRLLHRQC